MPYADEIDLSAGAMDRVVWTWPWQIGIPLMDSIIDSLFPMPLMPIMPAWTQPIRDKWEGFVGWVKNWFSTKSGQTIQDTDEFAEMILEACAYAAAQMQFDIWDENEGLPSMPLYNVPVGGPN